MATPQGGTRKCGGNELWAGTGAMMQRFAGVGARVANAVRVSKELVASGAVDETLVWSVPRGALAFQLSLPPLDRIAFDYGEFVEGASHAYETLHALLYRDSRPGDGELLAGTCTPQIARVLGATAEELHGGAAPVRYTLEDSVLARRSLSAVVVDSFASPRERDLEYTLRGYDDALYLADGAARAALLDATTDELLALRRSRESGAAPPPDDGAAALSAEFDVLFESNERVSVEAGPAGSVVVEKRQVSTWRFVSPSLEAPEWRVAKIF